MGAKFQGAGVVATGAFTRRISVYLKIYQVRATVGAEYEVAGVVATGAFTSRAYMRGMKPSQFLASLFTPTHKLLYMAAMLCMIL